MARPTPLIPPPTAGLSLGEGRTLHLGEQLGRGSVATVYRGIHEGPFDVLRSVAVKVFDLIATEEREAVLGALANAARRWAAVRHPNVMQALDLGLVHAAQPYVVLELVEGRTLSRLLGALARRGERMPPDLALFIALEVAEALAGARGAMAPDGARVNVVHGDVSPRNVLLSWHGEVKLGDFGLDVASRVASSVRSRGVGMRRLQALAPEAARGQPASARADVFSLGVLLHEMLLGPRFAPGTTESQAQTLAREGAVHRPLFVRHLPAAVETVLARALAFEPADRYPHAGALAYDLRHAALSMGVGDGRSFLRTALTRTFGADGADDDFETTSEVRIPPRPIVDRFAKLRGENDEEP